MAVNCGKVFGLCAVRFTLLDADGNVAAGPGNSYVTDKQISVAMTPNIDTGNTFSSRNGCGCSLAKFKVPDVFNWWEFAFVDGALEPEMEALITGAAEITNGADVVGIHGPEPLSCSEGERQVAVELWTKHIVNSKQDSAYPWIHWVFPNSVWQFNDNTAQEDFLDPAYQGFSRSNDLWGAGPYGDGPPDGSDVTEWAKWKTAIDPPAGNCASASVTPSS